MEQVCREVEVSRSGYYGWLKHTPSERSRRNQALRRRLVELHEKYPAMGLDSLYHLLKPEFGCSRKRVHRQMQLAALDTTYRRRKPAKGLIFRSDRGVQYASKAYRERLDAYGIRQSMTRRGDPYDNAVAENFFSCLKCELIHLKHYPTRSAAQCDVFAYLEIFYNTLRPHSALGWVSPSRFEDDLLRSAAYVSSQVKRAKFGQEVYQCRVEVSPGSIPAEKVSL